MDKDCSAEDEAGFYDGEDDPEVWDDADEGDWGEAAEHDPVAPVKKELPKETPYAILNLGDIVKRRNVVVDRVAEELYVSKSDAALLLNCFRWNTRELEDRMFRERKTTLSLAGVTATEGEAKSSSSSSSAPVHPSEAKMVQCQVGFCDEVPVDQAFALKCGHVFCVDCWKSFLQSQINSGPDAIHTVCMGMRCGLDHSHQPSCKCKELVPADVFARYISVYDYEKYERWLVDKFVECSPHIQWCTKPGCKYAIEYKSGGAQLVKCYCGTEFCFACASEPHHPVPCDLFRKWLELGGTASDSKGMDKATELLLASRTKPCPQCNVRIEKDKHCNHMRCTNCNHHFCWLCMRSWTGHDNYYECSTYAESSNKGIVDKTEQKLRHSNKFMQKFLWHQGRFEHCKQGMAAAKKMVARLENSDHPSQGPTFWMVDILKQIIESYRTLMWSFCLVFFMQASGKKELYERQQGLLSGQLDRLHDRLESMSVDDLFARMKNLKQDADLMIKTCSVLSTMSTNGEFEDVIRWEADLVTNRWACVACTMENEDPEARNCTTCLACRLHGEVGCLAPVCKGRSKDSSSRRRGR